MEINKIDIDKKNKIIDNTILRLKNEFIGIDDQIEQIMEKVRTWYLYPELQTRPTIVGVFGMTGVGKTDLLKKIAKYLDIEQNFVYYNFAEINEMHTYEIEDSLNEELDGTPNKFIVYDEFQYAATLGGNGEEKDNRSGLKTFWELMDSGVITTRTNFHDIRTISKCLYYLETIHNNKPIKVENGVWVNSEECLENFSNAMILEFLTFFNFKTKKVYKSEGNNDSVVGDGDEAPRKIYRNQSDIRINGYYESLEFENDEFIIRNDRICDIVSLKFKGDKTATKVDCINFIETLKNLKTFDEIYDTLKNVFKEKMKGTILDLSQSIIFVVANVDEAYTLCDDVNPDMSADQFNKLTKKISIIDIKAALQKRFRNEQIARLGNSYIIYPSFSKQNYIDIIELYLKRYRDKVKKLFDLNISFTKEIKNIIYKEGVFPTQGTRPLFSTINDVVETKLALIIQNINEYNISSFDNIEYSFKKKNVVINVYNKGNIIHTFRYKIKLSIENLRIAKKDERQAITAVHESGHFVLCSALYNKLPEKVISQSTDKSVGGFVLRKLDDNDSGMTIQDVENEIQICLGGYIAEKLVFGDKFITNGACSDIKQATRIASKAIREWGFDGAPFFKSYMKSTLPVHIVEMTGYALQDVNENYQEKILALLSNSYKKAEELLNTNEWKGMLKESAKYLSEHTEMPYKKMKEIYNKVSNSVKIQNNDRYYRECIDKI